MNPRVLRSLSPRFRCFINQTHPAGVFSLLQSEPALRRTRVSWTLWRPLQEAVVLAHQGASPRPSGSHFADSRSVSFTAPLPSRGFWCRRPAALLGAQDGVLRRPRVRVPAREPLHSAESGIQPHRRHPSLVRHVPTRLRSCPSLSPSQTEFCLP